MEMPDYINQQPSHEQKCSSNTDRTETRILQVLFLSFGVLCMVQAILNVSLRLTLHSNQVSTASLCNTTTLGVQNQKEEGNIDSERKNTLCNSLQKRVNDLTGVKNLLENKISELNNKIKRLEEEKDRLSALSGCGSSSKRCPANWIEMNRRCYFMSSERRTWDDSRTDCQIKGADLVVINSELEQNALYRLYGDPLLLFWIGLRNTDRTFRWVDGSALNKLFWQPGQPDSVGFLNREDCVEMNLRDPVEASWNDAPCGQHRRWLCEKDPRVC